MAYVELIFLYLLLKYRHVIADIVGREHKTAQQLADEEFVRESLKPGAGLDYVSPKKSRPKLWAIRGGKQ